MHATKCEEAGVKRPLRESARRLSLVLSVALSLGLISAAVITPALGEATEDTEEEDVEIPASVANPIRLADAALSEAKLEVARRQFDKAITSLESVRANVEKAHRAGMAQIGKPPSDPESDDPPGPAAVIAVLDLEHRVVTGVVPFFNGGTETAFIDALHEALEVTYNARDKMLNRVVEFDPEEEGADYSDDMSDTLDIYTAEVNQVTTALKQYQLSQSGRAALSNALARVRATEAKVNKAFGGGE
jgi:hypothetical protein